jgi:hypothetical protein
MERDMSQHRTRINRRTALGAGVARRLRRQTLRAGRQVRPGRVGDRDQARPDHAVQRPGVGYGTIGKVQQAYFKMINDNGGINGRKINLISLDDGYSPPKAVEQVRRLVEQDEVLALFQTLGTPSNSAIHKYVNAKKVPHLLLATGATKWGDPKELSVDDGLQPELPVRGPDLRQVAAEEQADAKIGDPLPERRLRQGRAEGRQGRARRGRREDDRQGGDLRGHRSDDRFADPDAAGLGRRHLHRHHDAEVRRAGGAKAFDSGWKPLHILNNVSASIGSVLVPAGVEKAVGAITVAYYKDQNDPQWKDDPAMLEWRAFMGRYYREGDPKDASNLYGYLAAQIMVQILKQCGNDLTRENVMRQAANLKHFKLPLLLPGMELNTGPSDFFPVQQAHLQKFTGTQWQLFGETISTGAQP